MLGSGELGFCNDLVVLLFIFKKDFRTSLIIGIVESLIATACYFVWLFVKDPNAEGNFGLLRKGSILDFSKYSIRISVVFRPENIFLAFMDALWEPDGVLLASGSCDDCPLLLVVTISLQWFDYLLSAIYYVQCMGLTTLFCEHSRESASVVTCLEGYQMQGRESRPALAVAAIGPYCGDNKCAWFDVVAPLLLNSLSPLALLSTHR